ncbi:MAG: hypothetical protein IJA69_05590 [Clostridia bacterium]|nr:hypothetical protein [Clostridia bacterium]
MGYGESSFGESTYYYTGGYGGGESTGESSYQKDSYDAKPAVYKNKEKVKAMFAEIKAKKNTAEAELKNVMKEYKLVPETCTQAKQYLKQKIEQLRLEIENKKRELLQISLENPEWFDVEINDVTINER